MGILNFSFLHEDETFYDNPQAPAFTNNSNITTTTSFNDDILSPNLIKPFSEIRIEPEGRTGREVNENSSIENYLQNPARGVSTKKRLPVKNKRTKHSIKGQKQCLELEIQALKEDVKKLKMKRDECKRNYDIMHTNKDVSQL